MMSHSGFCNIAYAIMWCNETVLCLCCSYYMHDSSFRSPWVQNMCSAFLHPLFSLSLYWEFIVVHSLRISNPCVGSMCSEFQQRSAHGLWVTETTVRGQVISEICPFHFQSEWPVCQFTKSQVQMTSSWSDITWQHQIASSNQQTKPLRFIWIN